MTEREKERERVRRNIRPEILPPARPHLLYNLQSKMADTCQHRDQRRGALSKRGHTRSSSTATSHTSLIFSRMLALLLSREPARQASVSHRLARRLRLGSGAGCDFLKGCACGSMTVRVHRRHVVDSGFSTVPFLISYK